MPNYAQLCPANKRVVAEFLQNYKRYTTYTWQWVYGWNWNWYWSWYYRYWYWYYGYEWWWHGYWGYWVQVPQTEYRLETTTHSINGAIVAQTFLISSAFWLTNIGLYFTQTDNNAPINIIICETTNGKPDLQKTLTMTTVQPSDIRKYPQETIINITPVYLKPGRYAICFITQGSDIQMDKRLATEEDGKTEESA